MIKTPRDFMFDNLEDEQSHEAWMNYLETLEKEVDDDEDGE